MATIIICVFLGVLCIVAGIILAKTDRLSSAPGIVTIVVGVVILSATAAVVLLVPGALQS